MIPKNKTKTSPTPDQDDFYEKYIPGPEPLDWERAKHIVYEAFRDPNDELSTSTGVLVDDVPNVLPWRRDLYNHSPTGLEWGYGGSGPHQFALAILAHATRDDTLAVALHWKFARQVISRKARSGFRLTGTEVLEWVEAHPIDKEKRFNYLPMDKQGELIDRSIIEDFMSECCKADLDYQREGRKAFAVCRACGHKYEF